MEGKPFEVLELKQELQGRIDVLKESLFELQGSHILRFLHLIRENPCQPVALASKKQEFEVPLKCLKQNDDRYRKYISKSTDHSILIYISCL